MGRVNKGKSRLRPIDSMQPHSRYQNNYFYIYISVAKAINIILKIICQPFNIDHV